VPKRDSTHMASQRERILRAAFECIAEKGVEKTSISDLCAKAGLSRGALYIHFRNKDEIIVETLRFGTIDIRSMPTEWEAFKASLFNIDNAIGFEFSVLAKNRFHLAVEAFRPGIFRQTFKDAVEQHLGRVTETLESMAEHGSIKLKMDAPTTAFAIGALFDGVLWGALAVGKDLRALRQQLNDSLDCFVEPLT
jgi:AcrR family transcriptional regulator